MMVRLQHIAFGIIALSCAPPFVASSLADESPLRSAIEDLSATFADRYPDGRAYLERLNRLESDMSKADASQRDRIQRELDSLRRESLLANPLVSEYPILFVVRPQYKPDHHNTETMFQTGEINTGSFEGGAALKAVDLAQRGHVTTLLQVPNGIARDPDVSFDGRKVLLALRHNRADDYHLYEISSDGTGLVQLTFATGISDIDPIYLPDGRIAFTSTREPKYCMCNRHIMGNLFVMESDGANIRQIGHSTLHEGHASLAPDGRILYDRWEYVDRNFGDAQGVWAVHPDGVNHNIYWGNNTNSPGAVLDVRTIPSSEQFIATFSSCHDRPWGGLAIVDRRFGIDGQRPVVRTWPAEAINLVGEGNYDTFTRVMPKYEDPFPLSQKYFLCSRMTGHGEQMGIFLLDVFGNEVLLHFEGPGCFDPMPLRPRLRPPTIPLRSDLAKDEGFFYVADIYKGHFMDGIERGSVKYLRIVESPEKRFWTQPAWDGGTGQQAPGMAYDDFNNKRILGTVPVDKDGSAYFAVPSDTYVYFQLLDERGMMVQSMRSGTIVRPGETTGCAGCHENRLTSVSCSDRPQAMAREPSRLQPWYGVPRTFSYAAEVQPVFDKHCVRCHDEGQNAGQKLNLSGDVGLVFNRSYVELRSKGLVSVVGAGPFQVQPPRSWGASASRLTNVLMQGHGKPEIDREIRLDREDFDRIVTWIDINAPYYPEYASVFPENRYGRAPLNEDQLKRLTQLTGVDLSDRVRITDVSFTRPELSRCLHKFTDKNDVRYREALAIIESGKRALAAETRAEQPGFKLSVPGEIKQQAKYEVLQRTQAESRAAIVAGRRHYERP